MDSELIKMMLGAALRHAAGALGGWLLNQGLVDANGKTQVIGAVMLFGAIAWSWWKKAGAAKVEAMLKAATSAGAKATPAIAVLIALSVSAFAADVPSLPVKAFKPVNPFAQAYDIGRCGAYFGVNTMGSTSAVNSASATPGTQVVQGAIGGTLGYGCPINAANGSFWFVEVMADINNLNGATNGLSLSGPASFTERFGVGSPLQQLFGVIPGLGSGSASAPAVPNLPTLPNGITAGPGSPYAFVALHQDDFSYQLGLAQNQQWLISGGVGLGIRYRLSNGVVADTFAEYDTPTNSLCLGPLGGSACAKKGQGARVGVQFLY